MFSTFNDVKHDSNKKHNILEKCYLNYSPGADLIYKSEPLKTKRFKPKTEWA